MPTCRTDVQERKGVLFLVYLPDFLYLLRDGELARKDHLYRALFALVALLAKEQTESDVVISFFFNFRPGGLLQMPSLLPSLLIIPSFRPAVN